MIRVKVVLVASALVGAAAAAWAADGQDAKPPDIRMLLNQGPARVAPDAAAVPDLRDLPKPKIDKPPIEPPVTIILGDPRCYPGEDGFTDPRQLRSRSRRSH